MEKNTIFFLEKIYDHETSVSKDDTLLNVALNHSLFGTIKGYDEGKLKYGEGLIFEYHNQPGNALKSAQIISVGDTPYKTVIMTRDQMEYVFRKTNL